MKVRLKKELPYLGFILPAFIVYTVLTIFPLIQTLTLSFTDWDGFAMTDLNFVGLQNFETVFRNRAMRTALTNTISYSFVFTLLTTFFAIPLALALNSKMRTRNIQRAMFFFPSVPSAIILGYLWAFILAPHRNGLFNIVLGWFGIEPVLWLALPNTAMLSLLMVNLWNVVGWHACIYLAQLQSIPAEYYEAAKVDGASAWQRFRFVTFPMLAGAMTISVMLLLVNSLRLFDLPFALTGGGPGTATTMISQEIIRVGFIQRQYGAATAISTIFFVFISVVSIIQLTLMKRREVS